MTGFHRAVIFAASVTTASLIRATALADGNGTSAFDREVDCKSVAVNGIRLQSGIWRNLHHLLYAQTSASGSSTRGRVPLLVEDAATLHHPEDRATWNEALVTYGALIQRDLLFDEELVRIGRVLSHAGDDLASTDLPTSLRQALTATRPIYERLYWDRHRRINSSWCGVLQPRLARYSQHALDRLADIYGTSVPDRVAIEVSVYANWAGAYTILDPVEIIIASGHPSNVGDAAFEIAIHEISHAMVGNLRRDLDETIRREGAGQVIARDLWHQILFYIAGEIVADLIPGYTAYADRNNLWIRVWPGAARGLMETHLRPVLDGDTSLDKALGPLVADLAKAEPGNTAATLRRPSSK